MGITGYIVAIPVFVDVAYIMLQSITESLSVSSKKNILVVGLSLAAGLTATHALLPPTPGPLAAAGIMEANLGKVIMINFVVAIFATTAGILWATFYCKKFRLSYDEHLTEKYQRIEITDGKQKISKTFLCQDSFSEDYFSKLSILSLVLSMTEHFHLILLPGIVKFAILCSHRESI